MPSSLKGGAGRSILRRKRMGKMMGGKMMGGGMMMGMMGGFKTKFKFGQQGAIAITSLLTPGNFNNNNNNFNNINRFPSQPRPPPRPIFISSNNNDPNRNGNNNNNLFISSFFQRPMTPPITTTTQQREEEEEEERVGLTARSDDLGIRYSKVKFPEEESELSRNLPLTSEQFPLDLQTATWLRKSFCVSVITADDCWECTAPEDRDNEEEADVSSIFARLISQVGGHPTHPSNDTDSDYWKELQHVTTMQLNRRQDERARTTMNNDDIINPNTIMPLPDLWKNFSMSEVAEAVHDEYPGIHHVNLIQYLLSGLQVDDDIIPRMARVEFLRRIVMLSDLNTWSIARVGPLNFGAKYYVGRARPEEVAYQIATGQLTEGVPSDLVDSIRQLNLMDAVSYTAYPEGSPMHPSWPAMHSAASSASLWMATVLNLTDEQYCQVKRTDYAVAYGRTVAGVHYPSDNIAGLNMGQEIVAQLLPRHLQLYYGSDVEAVRTKIERLRFDWNDFLDTPCGQIGNE